MSKAILSSLQGQYFWWLSIFMDSKLQPVQLYGFSKSRLYEPLGTAIFFRNRFCPVSWILLFLPVHFYGYSLYPKSRTKTAFVINGKIKSFPSWKSPETVDAPGFAPDASIPVTLYGAEGGIWTLACFLDTYSLSRGAPSASWVLLHADVAG